MRLWSIHPKYLDTKGLVALWREALLAQKVLSGQTRGYRNHPQLRRFSDARDPMVAIGSYLHHVYEESLQRGYRFDVTKIGKADSTLTLEVSSGQVAFERRHLLEKLKARDRSTYSMVQGADELEVHPLFRVETGEVAEWEKTGPPLR